MLHGRGWLYIRSLPSKHETLAQRWFTVGPTSEEKMRTEVKMVLQYLFSTSLLPQFTVSQLLTIC